VGRGDYVIVILSVFWTVLEIPMKLLTDKPLISNDVLNYLERQFPDKLPKDENISVEKLRFLQGQQSVIEKVRQLTNIDDEE
jgi:hypothetical protein